MDNAIDEMRDYTSIRVEKEIRDRLDTLGKRRESYNEIIKRLIDFFEQSNKKE
jgi:predicted DNA-binding protein